MYYHNGMKKYVSHFSAARLWDIPYLPDVFGAKYMKKRLDDGIQEITVLNPNARYKKKGVNMHYSKQRLPRNAVVRKDNEFVASPELIFVQLANQLDIHHLILLGLIMCAEFKNGNFKQLTTKRKLESFISKVPNYNGVKKARRAVRYIENSAGSIMEIFAFMILTLPNALGGFGLRGSVFNYEVPLKVSGRNLLEQKRCFLDLFFARENLAVEYDSFKHHSTPTEQAKDQLRASVLENQRIKVIKATTVQLYRESACHELAQNVASGLNRRIQIRTSKFERAHEKLRVILPREKKEAG